MQLNYGRLKIMRGALAENKKDNGLGNTQTKEVMAGRTYLLQ